MHVISMRICRMSSLFKILPMWSSTSQTDFQTGSGNSTDDDDRPRHSTRFSQLYPLFVIETLGRFPGLTGLFIASILSASLSTVSSGVNSITTVLFEDIYKRIVQDNTMTDRQQATISKILCKKRSTVFRTNDSSSSCFHRFSGRLSGLRRVVLRRQYHRGKSIIDFHRFPNGIVSLSDRLSNIRCLWRPNSRRVPSGILRTSRE